LKKVTPAGLAVRASPLPDLSSGIIEREGDVDAFVRVNPDRDHLASLRLQTPPFRG
jgi:hypothetical protein